MKPSRLDQILLLLTALLASYQVAIGIEGLETLSILAYTIGFGILLIAVLLILILGFEVLDLPAVVIVSTLLPLSLATGLMWQYLPSLRSLALTFASLGFLAVTVTRWRRVTGRLAWGVLTVVHGLSGLVLLVLPVYLVFSGSAKVLFLLISLGSALIGLTGLLLVFLRHNQPKADLGRLFPPVLFFMALCFTLGFALG